MLKQFDPDLIIISAGFDAARGDSNFSYAFIICMILIHSLAGDPLGGMDVTPQGYAAMTSAILSVCSRVLVSLEGGYNLSSIAESAYAVLEVMPSS